MEDRKTEFIKQWQYNKDHIFIFAHDGLCLKKFIDFNPKWLAIMLALYIFISLLTGLLLGLALHNVLGAIKGCLIFYGICFVLDRIYSYYLYLNYIEVEHSMVIPIVSFVIASFTQELFNNVFLTICSFIIVSIISIKVCKSVYYEKQNNLNKFLEENGVDVNEKT